MQQYCTNWVYLIVKFCTSYNLYSKSCRFATYTNHLYKLQLVQGFSVNLLFIFYGNSIYLLHSHIKFYAHKIRYIFNKIVNLTKILLNPTYATVLYKLGLFDSEILYKLQLVQQIL